MQNYYPTVYIQYIVTCFSYKVKIQGANTKTMYIVKLHYFQVFQEPNILIITTDLMCFTPHFKTIILKLYILTQPWSFRSRCKVRKQGNSCQLKQKYQFAGSLVPRPLNLMALYYYIPHKARFKSLRIQKIYTYFHAP